MPKTTYEQHEAAFKHVSAYALLDFNNQLIAKISFKFPKDGAGRLYCYFHWHGHKIVRGYANGHGYRKATAAILNAMKKLTSDSSVLSDIKSALETEDYKHWTETLSHAEFIVIQVI